jgi:hypothetical protein
VRGLGLGKQHDEVVAEDHALELSIDLAVLREVRAQRAQVIERPGARDRRVEKGLEEQLLRVLVAG